MALMRFVLSLAWIAVIAYYAWMTWPIMPLDSGTDPDTSMFYGVAVRSHVAYYAAIALGPPLLAWIVARIAARRA